MAGMKMPVCYVAEMFVDRISASKNYQATVSRTIGLARKRISCGMKPAMLKSALKGR